LNPKLLSPGDLPSKIKYVIDIPHDSIPHAGLSVRTGVGGYIGKVGGQQSSSLKKCRQIFYCPRGHPPRPENLKAALVKF
jgi:hypothetical protein